MADQPVVDDGVMQQIAAELARDIFPLPDILKRFAVKHDTFERIKTTRAFQIYLAEAKITWESSLNSRERTKVKAEAMVETMLEPAFRAYADQSQPLAARVALLQTVAKLAGMLDQPKDGLGGAAVARPGDRVTININLGPGRNGDQAKVITIDQPQLDLPASDPVDEVVLTGVQKLAIGNPESR